MAEKRWVVDLCDAERLELDRLINTGRAAARTILKARILLKADQASSRGWTDAQIAEAQCLKRRIPDAQHLEDEVNAWLKDRNANNVKADWRFTTEKARVKLKSLYAVI